MNRILHIPSGEFLLFWDNKNKTQTMEFTKAEEYSYTVSLRANFKRFLRLKFWYCCNQWKYTTSPECFELIIDD